MDLDDVKVPAPRHVVDALPCFSWAPAGAGAPTPVQQQQQLHCSNSGSGAPASGGACAVCQLDYEEGDVLMGLPCRHAFHKECVATWLGSYSKKCPACKAPVCRE